MPTLHIRNAADDGWYEIGAQGSQGYQGYQGAPGPQGTQGNQGYQGYQGGLGAHGHVLTYTSTNSGAGANHDHDIDIHSDDWETHPFPDTLLEIAVTGTSGEASAGTPHTHGPGNFQVSFQFSHRHEVLGSTADENGHIHSYDKTNSPTGNPL
jgi:hypothetical protein